ncbi:MAG: hypothetical protein WAO83_17720 [Fuerstiella sp.]|jgi:hypothetical protein
MIKWSLLLVIPTLLLCSTASAQYGDVVNGPDGPQSTMPIGDGDGGSGPSEPEWNIEFLYGSISGMMLSYEPAANCIQVDGTFNMHVPEGDLEPCIYACLYGGVADGTSMYTLNPGEALSIDINDCAPYDGPGSYFMLMMLGRCPAPFYFDELTPMIQVDSQMSEFILTAPGP